MSTDPAYLTPDEQDALRLVRLQALRDAGDLQPMRKMTSRYGPLEIVPLIEAINWDPGGLNR